MSRSRRRGKQKIQFSSRTHPKSGILSLVLGALSLLILLFLCLVSGAHKGNPGTWVGVAGIWTLVLSVVGFVVATKSYRMEDIYMITPRLGSILNGLVMVTMVILYVIGAM
ncbi:MAG: hypothetical protein IKQ97_00265 [Eubacterium sp.]|nr:hypothetical protein [Eubacterium sp.]